VSGGAPEDGMMFPAKEYPLADRKRWQRQNNASEESFNRDTFRAEVIEFFRTHPER
jgi:hypothetical protein